jgi:hypothetical protein
MQQLHNIVTALVVLPGPSSTLRSPQPPAQRQAAGSSNNN